MNVLKLEDAVKAGTVDGHLCSLILTEGDLAKALAMAGISAVGRDYYGVFPLRGKLLNVRDAETSKVLANEEISNIVKILGLEYGKKYTDTRATRYGSVIVMTDADQDGAHIFGLVLNFFDAKFQSLLCIDGFMRRFITPVVKAVKGITEKCFYRERDYHAWAETTPQSGWRVRYYKGLGTSTSKEGVQYFRDLAMNVKQLDWDGKSADAIDRHFSKKRADDRKELITNFDEDRVLDNLATKWDMTDWIETDLTDYSRADTGRSIPGFDGLKTTQRKVLYGTMARPGSTASAKVAELGGIVGASAAYHHGEKSMTDTIMNLAQDFVGSNNIPILVPEGQFGTRCD